MDRCVVIGGVADGNVVDVKPEHQYMAFSGKSNINPQIANSSEYDYLTDSYKIKNPNTTSLYRKEWLKAKNKNDTYAEIPFLVDQSLSTADAIRKVLFSYRTRK